VKQDNKKGEKGEKFLTQKRQREEDINNNAKNNTKPVFKNKLFSNAMEKIANSYKIQK
jgi:hypothetical protein